METAPRTDTSFARCVHGIGGSGHQHGHGHCDGPQAAPILSVVRYGGHSRITYQWRGGVVSEEGPAGRTAERVAAIIERGGRLMSTDTSHEARARNAKAQALAAVLYEHRITPASLTTILELLARQCERRHHRLDNDLVAAFWAKVAEVATLRQLMGVGVTVHPPHSQATVDAVARILGDLIAHEERAEHLETASCNGRAYQVNPDEPSEGIDIHHDRYCPAHPDVRWGEPVRPKNLRAQALFDESVAATRRPTDSAGYRKVVGQLDRETAQAFAAFGQADRR